MPSDAVQGFFNDGHSFGRAMFHDIVMTKLMFVAALFLVVQWHVRTAFARAPWMRSVKESWGHAKRNVRRIGLNIIILHVYFNPSMPEFIQRRKFTGSLALIYVETYLLYHAVRYLAYRTIPKDLNRASVVEDHKPPVVEDSARGGTSILEPLLMLEDAYIEDEDPDPRWDDDPDDDGGEDDLTDSMYMDLTVGFHSILPIFIIQVALLLFYINELNDPDSDTKDEHKVEFGYWIIGVLIQLFAGLVEEIAESNPVAETSKVSKQTLYLYDKIPVTYLKDVARDLIMFTFPIMLCVEEPLDFVKDCTAVFFMVSLDDLGFEKAKTVAQMMVRLKFNIYYEHLKVHAGLDLEIPLRFTEDEAKSAEFDPMAWDQFENQREYVSPHLKETTLLEYMRSNIEPGSGGSARTSTA
eukprot:CAMPEP_0168487160 /NCGR_PEP_ID=MMETSP0228-20121227/67492_1 /TAXON_ID=133427 /ORGANISM="Protoceratium reticulatum, Strain CCCM 535 (=CCMP 1889)" /LENGTH=410 /DNA_ID=CAMNT_0008503767 /DNA_START=30 /DNA_END=1264 /DNA_ORIENTATION=-